MYKPPEPSNIVEMVGNKLLSKEANGKLVVKEARDVLRQADIIGIYFSAHWCPPCRLFTPKLTEAYELLKQMKIEIIFISSDTSEDSFLDYYKDMPWLALPYGSKEIGELKTRYNVKGIPTLYFIEKSSFAYATVNNERGDQGRKIVENMSTGQSKK